MKFMGTSESFIEQLAPTVYRLHNGELCSIVKKRGGFNIK